MTVLAEQLREKIVIGTKRLSKEKTKAKDNYEPQERKSNNSYYFAQQMNNIYSVIKLGIEC